ncbi:MAG: hypothetical protein ABSD71_10595 [Bacteroidales bacterium]|jgi:hypothetical protein
MKKNLLFVLTILILLGCHKNDEESQSHVDSYINSGIKSQEFKPGSYWIYQNDSTQKTDSTYVYYAHQGIEVVYHGLGYFTSDEYYEMWYYNDNRTNGYPSFKDRIESEFVWRTINSNVYEPIWEEIYTLDTSYPLSRVLFFDSLQLGNHMFYKVDKVTTPDSTDYYTAKSIGVVKKVVRDTIDKGIWNLLRWKIIK